LQCPYIADGCLAVPIGSGPNWRNETLAQIYVRSRLVGRGGSAHLADSKRFGRLFWHRVVPPAFQVPREWKDRNLRVEFEAVYHSATVWVNGQEAGQHLRKGYTAFTLDITPYLEFGASNSMVVRVGQLLRPGHVAARPIFRLDAGRRNLQAR